MVRILVAESDPVELLTVAGTLRRHGFEVPTANTAESVITTAPTVDLVVLGLPIPGVDGLDLCARIRARSSVPIIGTVPRGSPIDVVTGLRAGLDAHLTRPFGLRELVARVDSILRRTLEGGVEWSAISCGPLRIDVRTREVYRCGERIQVTRKEFDLLRLLAAEPDRLFSRREIMGAVWDDQWGRSDRTIDTHVNSLRNKIGDPAAITTVRGVGFRIGYHAMMTGRAPLGRAPADTAPADAAPSGTAPSGRTSTGSAPADAAPDNRTSADGAPDHTAPDHTAPSGRTPAHTAPADTAPAHHTPADTAPDNTAPSGRTPAHTPPTHTPPADTAPPAEAFLDVV
jgi:DNA-binding response OmpR family regulator